MNKPVDLNKVMEHFVALGGDPAQFEQMFGYLMTAGANHGPIPQEPPAPLAPPVVGDEAMAQDVVPPAQNAVASSHLPQQKPPAPQIPLPEPKPAQMRNPAVEQTAPIDNPLPPAPESGPNVAEQIWNTISEPSNDPNLIKGPNAPVIPDLDPGVQGTIDQIVRDGTNVVQSVGNAMLKPQQPVIDQYIDEMLNDGKETGSQEALRGLDEQPRTPVSVGVQPEGRQVPLPVEKPQSQEASGESPGKVRPLTQEEREQYQEGYDKAFTDEKYEAARPKGLVEEIWDEFFGAKDADAAPVDDEPQEDESFNDSFDQVLERGRTTVDNISEQVKEQLGEPTKQGVDEFHQATSPGNGSVGYTTPGYITITEDGKQYEVDVFNEMDDHARAQYMTIAKMFPNAGDAEKAFWDGFNGWKANDLVANKDTKFSPGDTDYGKPDLEIRITQGIGYMMEQLPIGPDDDFRPVQDEYWDLYKQIRAEKQRARDNGTE